MSTHWVCLRSITEFEFEKSCRGSQPPSSIECSFRMAKVTSEFFSSINMGVDLNKSQVIIVLQTEMPQSIQMMVNPSILLV